mmetsp:Transcript_25313/g.35502  ORF Transcript_25313/g.35502 Transcript_25313/m.35502 type:complete len:228 (+) Transcript_25313:35-718(+)
MTMMRALLLVLTGCLCCFTCAFQTSTSRRNPVTFLSSNGDDDNDDDATFPCSHHEQATKTSAGGAAEVSRRVALTTGVSTSAMILTTPFSAALAFDNPFANFGGAPEKMPVEELVAELEKQNKGKTNSNGDPAKHVPNVKMSPASTSGSSLLEVSVPHVMDPEQPHYIQAIWLKDAKTDEIVLVKVFPPDASLAPPTFKCGAPKGVTLKPMLYCNLHGLWEGEPFTV